MLNDDYIKRSDVLAMTRYISFKYDELGPAAFEIRVERIPAADVEQVKHGHWIPINRTNPSWSQFGIAQHKCSECGSEETIARKRCPECGAKMMWEEDDGESTK